MNESCANCRYSREHGNDLCCHRKSPDPHSFLRYHELELIREIAWNSRVIAGLNEPGESDELNIEATEALIITGWPEVEREDWCGEWRPKTA